MDKNYLHVLVPNKNSSRFFGVDFFADLTTGSSANYAFYSTSIDFNQVFRNEIVSFSELKLKSLESELANRHNKYIIGLNRNPDIYQSADSLKPVIDVLSKYEQGLYLETDSLKILDDIEILAAYATKQPLLVALPISTLKNDRSVLFGNDNSFENISRIANKLGQRKISFGFLVKPIIPFINDDIAKFVELINKLIDLHPDFIYTSFSLGFDSAKLKAFYNVIDKHYPGLKVKLMDNYGYKNSWMSPNAPELKKQFVFLVRKAKVAFSMRDIINLYKPDQHKQLKLF